MLSSGSSLEEVGRFDLSLYHIRTCLSMRPCISSSSPMRVPLCFFVINLFCFVQEAVPKPSASSWSFLNLKANTKAPVPKVVPQQNVNASFNHYKELAKQRNASVSQNICLYRSLVALYVVTNLVILCSMAFKYQFLLTFFLLFCILFLEIMSSAILYLKGFKLSAFKFVSLSVIN